MPDLQKGDTKWAVIADVESQQFVSGEPAEIAHGEKAAFLKIRELHGDGCGFSYEAGWDAALLWVQKYLDMPGADARGGRDADRSDGGRH